jgi:hypothetical protein
MPKKRIDRSMRLYYDARTFMPENPVRGDDDQTGDLFTYVSPEARVPRDHPLRVIWRLTDALARLSRHFDQICPHMGRPSILREQVVRALFL